MSRTWLSEDIKFYFSWPYRMSISLSKEASLNSWDIKLPIRSTIHRLARTMRHKMEGIQGQVQKDWDILLGVIQTMTVTPQMAGALMIAAQQIILVDHSEPGSPYTCPANCYARLSSWSCSGYPDALCRIKHGVDSRNRLLDPFADIMISNCLDVNWTSFDRAWKKGCWCVQNTMNFHYGKHHVAYATNMNKQIEGTELADKPLEEVCCCERISHTHLFRE